MLAKDVYKDTITIYNYYVDKKTGKETYKRTVKENVFWNENSNSIFRKTGTVVPGSVALNIPYDYNYVCPEVFKSIPYDELDEKWTVENGADKVPTYVFRGVCDFGFEFSSGDNFIKDYIRPFEKQYKCKRAKDIDEVLYGGRAMWQIVVRL